MLNNVHDLVCSSNKSMQTEVTLLKAPELEFEPTSFVLPLTLPLKNIIVRILWPGIPHQYYLALSFFPSNNIVDSLWAGSSYSRTFTQYGIHPASVSLSFGDYTVNNHCAFHFTLQFKLVKLYKLAFGWFSSPHKCTALIAWWQKCSSDNPNWSTFH